MIKKCKACGKEFKIPPAYAIQGRGNYCDRACWKKRKLSLQHLGEVDGYNVHVDPRGYARIGDEDKQKYLHTYLMEKHLGRKLLPGELIHHIDGNPLNNRLENLQLLTSAKDHRQLHAKDRLEARGGIFGKHRICPQCDQVKTLKLFPRDSSARQGRGSTCLECKRIRDRDYRQRRKASK